MTDCHPPPLLCGQSQRSEEGIDYSCWPCQSCVRRRKCRVSRRSCLRQTLKNRIQIPSLLLYTWPHPPQNQRLPCFFIFSLALSHVNHVQSLNAPKLLRLFLRCLHSSQNTTSLRVAVVRMQFVVVHTKGPFSVAPRKNPKSRASVPFASACLLFLRRVCIAYALQPLVLGHG